VNFSVLKRLISWTDCKILIIFSSCLHSLMLSLKLVHSVKIAFLLCTFFETYRTVLFEKLIIFSSYVKFTPEQVVDLDPEFLGRSDPE
jgi:hypothetical protein